MTDSLLKEVDNALKWHRLEKLWHKSGKQITLFVSLAAIALIALLLYKQQEKAAQQAQSDALLRGLSSAYEAPQQGADTLDMTSLNGSFAQLGGLIQGSPQSSPNVANGSSLLNEYACLLAHLNMPEQTPNCQAGVLFGELLLEPNIARSLASQGINEAYNMLPPAPPMTSVNEEPARISMLRAYLRSRADAPAPSPQQDASNSENDNNDDETAPLQK